MKKIIITSALLSFALTACNKPAQQTSDQALPDALTSSDAALSTDTASAPLATGDTAENALDWNGEYEGILPCADCEGIKTELELHSDKRYELTEEYLGKGQGNKFEIKGHFKFDTANPSLIVLDDAGENRKFFVGENFLQARAVETGEEITGPLAEHFKLVKQP